MMTLQAYLTPDPSLRDPLPSPELIPFTKRRRASRQINLHSKGSVRGYLHINGHPTWYESELEAKIALSFRARPNVADIIDQPPPVSFFDDSGIRRTHTFDWCVVETCGTRTLVAVKPLKLVERSGIRRVIELVAEQLDPKIADFVVLATEQKLTRIDNFNAELIYSARRETILDDDAIIDGLIRKLRGPSSIGDLVEASGINGSGFRAIVRAIADRRLVLTAYCIIDADAVVQRGRSNNDA